MVRISVNHMCQFRTSFASTFSHSETKSWFPGHMFKGLKQMQAKLAIVDCILEVHDARIPFSGRNPAFYSMLTAVRPHILILNKSDLIEPFHKKLIIEQMKLEKEAKVSEVLFTDCKSSGHGGVNKIISSVKAAIENDENYDICGKAAFNLMVIGIPNVGKSSLINRLRNIHLHKKKASSVGATPGITKSVLEKIKISEKPIIYLYDTPGVSQPKVKDMEVGLRLALCRTIKDSLVGEILIADYLLYCLNRQKIFSYVEYLHLSEPTDDIRLLLIQVAKDLNLTQNIRNSEGTIVRAPDLTSASRHFIKAFRDGLFGKILLDIEKINKVS